MSAAVAARPFRAVAGALGAALLAAAPAPAVTLTRGPYLQLLDAGGVTVVWNTDAPAACSVLVRPAGAPPGAATAVGGGTGRACAIPVGGLAPGTAYHYVARADGAPLHPEATFSTDHPGLPFRFGVLGDFGCGCDEQRAVRDRMGASDLDMILSTGDQVYDDGALDDQDRKLFDVYPALLRSIPFWPTLGNHDVRTDDGRPWRAVWHTPANNPAGSEHYYSFDFGNAHFVVLDSNDDLEPGSPQHEFLDADLAASGATWKFVAFHHTIYSSGEHGSSTGRREDLLPVLDRHGVDVVFMGHDHHYERTHPMRGDAVVAPGTGTVYVTTGGGGARVRAVVETNAFTAWAEAAHHFTRVTVDGTMLRAEMVRDDGAVPDAVVLTKSSEPPFCGDGTVQPGEECEPPGTVTCDASCRAIACDASPGAACDDGNPCTADGCGPDGCEHRAVAVAAPEALAALAARDACDPPLPPVVRRRVARAAALLRRPAGTGRTAVRRAARIDDALRRVETLAGRAAIAPACRASLDAAVALARIANGPCALTPVAVAADTYIERAAARRAHGAAARLEVGGGRAGGVTYLRFDLAGLRGPFRQAVLELSVLRGAPSVSGVYRVSSSDWAEGAPRRRGRRAPGLRWTDVDVNRDGVLDGRDGSPLVPAGRPPVASIGPLRKGERVRADVTAAVGGPGAYTFALTTGSEAEATFASSEDRVAARRPALCVTPGPAP